MNFEVGDTVVYPRHGAATIEAINVRNMRGQEMTFLTLRVNSQEMTIQVPADNVEMVGVREVVDSDGLDKVFEVLQAQYTDSPKNWSRRFKANQEKYDSGDVLKIAEVVRDLSRMPYWDPETGAKRAVDKKLSAGEKTMLEKARKVLISELVLANNCDHATANQLLTSVIEKAVGISLSTTSTDLADEVELEATGGPALTLISNSDAAAVSPADLEQLTVSQLKLKAKDELGLVVPSNSKKGQLIEMILAAGAESVADLAAAA